MKLESFNIYRDWFSDTVIVELLDFDNTVLEKNYFSDFQTAILYAYKQQKALQA